MGFTPCKAIRTVTMNSSPQISTFLRRQIKYQGNYIKIHFASAFPRQCFCRGWQDFILRALVFTSATSAKTSTRSKLVRLLPSPYFTKNKKYCVYNYCYINFVALTLLYAMQCALFSRQKLCFKDNFGCFI